MFCKAAKSPFRIVGANQTVRHTFAAQTRLGVLFLSPRISAFFQGRLFLGGWPLAKFLRR